MLDHLKRTVFLFMAALLFPVAGSSAADVTYESVDLELEPASSYMSAVAKLRIEVEQGRSREVFLLGSDFEVKRVLLNGTVVRPARLSAEDLERRFGKEEGFFEGAVGLEVELYEGSNVLEVSYGGTVYDTLKVPEYSRGTIAEETRGLIGSEGVYLGPRSFWYPSLPDDFSLFTVKVETPKGMEAVTEGKRVKRSARSGKVSTTWEMNYPTKEITLVAGRYVVHEENMDGIEIMAYFFQSERDLIEDYMRAVRKYIDMYNRLIGPYPFSKFAVVENFFPTGYGMPSYTLLGRRVVRLPFIVKTSLGHEVAHNWWGNSVYPDYESGNWCEGLTVYYADHRYKEAISDSAAADYRRVLLTDYATYVHPDDDFPLSAFRERTTPGSRAIGYGKCAFVFHMLRRMVGDETFYRTMRAFYEKYRFRTASWTDIEHVFEKTTGRDLSRYFDQWVERAGAPGIGLSEAAVDTGTASFRVRIRLRQDPVYDLRIPVVVSGADTSMSLEVELDRPDSLYVIECGFEPVALRVDPGYDVFRRLDPMEIPPTISAVLGDRDLAVVLPSRADDEKLAAYRALAEQLARSGKAFVAADTALTVSDLEKRSFLILGAEEENALLAMTNLPPGVDLSLDGIRVAGKNYEGEGASAYFAFRSPFNPAKSACVVMGLSREAVEGSGYKIVHYGKYSYVTFTYGKRLEAGILPAPGNPMTVMFGGAGER